MKRRQFTTWAALAGAAPFSALLAGCGGGGDATPDGAHADASSPPRSATAPAPGAPAYSVYKHRAQPHPTGLRWGFWEVFTQQGVTLRTMGRRPSSRVGFDGWAAIELKPGEYSFPRQDRYADVHHHGETILGAVNISFRIPTQFYADDITNPRTREAAKNFLRAYVGWLLDNFGSAVLTIDYEIVSNYRLYVPGSEARGREWAAWYLEAAAVARQVAAERGVAERLKLQPIFNGDPFDEGNPIGLGGDHNPWLRDVVNASDFLALDTYHSDEHRPVTDATRTIEIIEFWIQHYAGDRPVVVTENGFTTITEQDGTITREDRKWKYTGTEAEQAAYYADLFPKLLAANGPGGRFNNQLRGFHFWSITDNPKADDFDDRFFGLYDTAGRAKPAAAVVQAQIAAAEADAFHRPFVSSLASERDLAGQLAQGSGDPVRLRFVEGDDYEFLRCGSPGPQRPATTRLKAVLAAPGSLLVAVNGRWQIVRDQTVFDVDLSADYELYGTNTIDLCVTAQSFPVVQQVVSLEIVHT